MRVLLEVVLALGMSARVIIKLLSRERERFDNFHLTS